MYRKQKHQIASSFWETDSPGVSSANHRTRLIEVLGVGLVRLLQSHNLLFFCCIHSPLHEHVWRVSDRADGVYIPDIRCYSYSASSSQIMENWLSQELEVSAFLTLTAYRWYLCGSWETPADCYTTCTRTNRFSSTLGQALRQPST